MFKKKALGLAMAHMAFVGFLVLWTSLIGDFFILWAFLTLAHVDPGLIQYTGPNC